ncbi:MAG: holo-ACP synthase [Chlamydiales bacterium]|nr:holo-ACP synthase [Chlamydiia bacterium]MCP5507299.1 holo-ACP synthase [Chlamydiales bacterium]
MIRGLGIDIIEVARINKVLEGENGRSFLERVFTSTESDYCRRHRSSAKHFAGRWAAKEAIAKALGTGLREEINWTDIEILNDDQGKPYVILSGRLNQKFENPNIMISISHCDTHASAVAIWTT